MDTEIIKIEIKDGQIADKSKADIARAGEILKRGGLVAFPTETVYGLGGDALNPDSSKKIYAAKGRPSDNPLIVHIAQFDDIYKIVGEVPEGVYKLAESFWPGPLTIILPKSEVVPLETTGGLDTVAVRFPSDVIARELIAAGGGYVAAPSANISGRPSPTEAKYVIEDMDGRIDVIIDGGMNEIGLESTIVDMTIDPPQVLRPGFITNEMLSDVLGKNVETDKALISADSGIKPRAPGMKYRHYAPKGMLSIVEGSRDAVIAEINARLREDKRAGKKTGVVTSEENRKAYAADVVRVSGKAGDSTAAAHNLYSILRSFDDEGVDSIYSESFSSDGFGAALMNRLLKAAGHVVIKA